MSEVRAGTAVASILIPPTIGLAGVMLLRTFRPTMADVAEMFSAGGWSTFVAALLGALGLIFVAFAGVWLARARTIPVALLAGVAMTPWIAGTAGSLMSLARVAEALEKVAESERAWVAASGISAAAQARVIGAFSSSVVLFALSAVLAVAALTAPRRLTVAASSALALGAAIFALSCASSIDTLEGALTLAMTPASSTPETVSQMTLAAAGWHVMRNVSIAILATLSVAQVAVSRTVPATATAALLLGLIGLDAAGSRAARLVASSVVASRNAEAFEFAPAPREDEGGRFDGTISRADVELSNLGLHRFKPGPQRRLGLALDRRLTKIGTERVLDALVEGDVREVDLFGESHVVSDSLSEELGDDAIYFRALARRRSAVRIALQSDVDPGALRANITDGPELALSSRVEAFDLSVTATAAEAEGSERRVFVRLREPAGVIELMRAAETLSLNGFQAVIAKEEKLGADPISEIVEANLGRFIRCYRPRLQEKPNLTGKVVVGFDVLPSGGVAHAAVKSSDMGDPPLEKCLAEEMKTLHFPNPKDDMLSVEYPFFFD